MISEVEVIQYIIDKINEVTLKKKARKCAEMVVKWLKNNTSLSWKRTSSDGPEKEIDKNFLNRKEGYEVSVFILEFILKNNLECTEKIIECLYNAINKYQSSKKLKREKIWQHLIKKINEEKMGTGK